MICFLVSRGYGFTVRPLRREANAPEIFVRTYDKALREPELPRATYIFTDIDRLGSSDLIAAAHLFRRLAASGCRTLNDPARVLTRLPLLRNLHRDGLNAFNVYALDEIDEIGQFPVFVRVANDHAGPLTDLIPDRGTLGRAIEALLEIGYPQDALMIVEYAAEPVRPGIFRKLSVFRVADRYLPHLSVHDVGWNIKAGRTGAAPAELYDEELESLRTNPFAEQMKRAFAIARIDYGRVDFGLVEGRPCIYEINTNPTLARPSADPVPQRVEGTKLWWTDFLSALHAIDGPEERGSPADVSVDDPATLGRALEIYPAVKDGFLHLGEAFARRGDGKAAIRSAETAIAQRPDDTRVAIRVSQLMADNENLNEAIGVVGRAMEADPNDFELFLHAGRLLARAHRAEAAVEAVARAMSLRPQDLSAYRALGEVQWLLGNRSAALKATKTAIRLASRAEGPAAVRQLKELRIRQRTLRAALIWQHLRTLTQPFRRVRVDSGHAGK